MSADRRVNQERASRETVNAIQIKVALRHVKPQICRLVLVPDSFTLGMLHRVIQIAMDWQDCHMHQFETRKTRYVSANDTEVPWEGAVCEDDVILRDVFAKKGEKLEYEYDFGDSWKHDLVVQAIVPIDPKQRHPVCLGGARACPPEDCGGVPGYYDVLDAVRHPTRADNKELLEWLESDYDPESFDIDTVNRRLRGAGWSPMARRSR